MKITLLGTGTPAPSAQRASSSYLVETGNDVFIFDCGPGSHARLLEAGVSPTRISQLCITHWHYDHFADLPSHVLRHWDQGAGKLPEMNIYGPRPIHRIMDLLFSSDGVFGPDLTARTKSDLSVGIYEARGGAPPRPWPKPKLVELEHRSTVEQNRWKLRAIEVPHTQPYLRSLAYRLDSPEGSFVYTGDFGPTAEMERFASGADIFVTMCHYITGSELNEGMLQGCGSHKMVATIARQARVGTLVLSHVTQQIDSMGVRERVIHEVSEIFNGAVILGEDLMQLAPTQAGSVRPI